MLANIPLLKSGLPPIIIPSETRREYLQLLAHYEVSVGQLDNISGVWPNPNQLEKFELFCLDCYSANKQIIYGN